MMPGLGIEPMALNLFYFIDFYVFIFDVGERLVDG